MHSMVDMFSDDNGDVILYFSSFTVGTVDGQSGMMKWHVFIAQGFSFDEGSLSTLIKLNFF